MLVVVMEVPDQLTHLFQGEAVWVKRENSPSVHVVDVCPHSLQGDACLAIVIDYLRNLIDITVAVSALMQLLIIG